MSTQKGVNMTSNEMEELILEVVTEHGGIKASVLITKVIVRYHESTKTEQAEFEIEDFHFNLIEIINNMVKTGKLGEIEYTVPGTERVKSFYVLPQTSVAIINCQMVDPFEILEKVTLANLAMAELKNPIKPLRQTHTYAILPVVKEIYEVIRHKLLVANYNHLLIRHGSTEVLNMHGIALQIEETR
jgi:hypothetical protein